jgi:hypothetical protein
MALVSNPMTTINTNAKQFLPESAATLATPEGYDQRAANKKAQTRALAAKEMLADEKSSLSGVAKAIYQALKPNTSKLSGQQRGILLDWLCGSMENVKIIHVLIMKIKAELVPVSSPDASKKKKIASAAAVKKSLVSVLNTKSITLAALSPWALKGILAHLGA